MDKSAEKVAKILLDIKSVTLSPKKPYLYASGILGPVYTDCRILISLPKERKKIIELYLSNIQGIKKQFDVIAGTATAGIPHAAWIADSLNLPMIYVRSKPKDHGKGNQIEGILKKGQKVAVIEDLVTTGGSCCEVVKAIRDAGGETKYIFSIFTYGTGKAEQNFKDNNISLIPLTDLKTVVKVAKDMGCIKENEKNLVLDFIKDPASWGKKMGFE